MRADFLLNYDIVTVAQERTLYLMARLSADAAPNNTARRPLNISLVLDKSGSMAGNKIDYVRQAAQLLVQHMSTEDTLSIVLYNESVETLLPPQPVQNKDIITQRIHQIKAGGTTNLSGGWLEGVQHVAQHHTQENVNRVILMTDGLANRGITATERLVEIAAQKFADGVSTTTMGLGEDFNEDLLIAMADAGGGAFYFIESPEVTPAIFQEELRGLLSVMGQNLRITVIPSAHVLNMRQMNAYPTESTPDGTAFRLGDIFAEEVKTLMLELHVPAMQSLGAIEIARLRFEYDELSADNISHQVREMSVQINIAQTEPNAPPALANPEVTRAMLLLKAAEARRAAIKLADAGNYGAAAKTLRDAAESIRQAGIKDNTLEEERGSLISQAADMDRGAEAYQSYSRKSMSTQAYFTGHGAHENTQALRKREAERQSTEKMPPEQGNIPNTNANVPPPMPSTKATGKFEAVSKTQSVQTPAPNIPVEQGNVGTASPTHMRWNGQLFALDRDLLRIGRAPQNELVMDVAGISRFHAQIRRQETLWILEDLNSTNGTHVAGRQLNQPYILREGDIVYFCDQRATFERIEGG